MIPLRKKCSYTDFFWSALSRIQTEYWDLQSKLARMRENTDQNTSEHGLFLCSVHFKGWYPNLLHFQDSNPTKSDS